MGSVGRTEGEHREYLQQNSFNNLDEYDEQILNDLTLRENNSNEQSDIAEEQIRAMERTAKKLDINSREGAQFINGVRRLLDSTEDERLRRRLQKILDELQ